jgi:penicillin-binding protein 2
MSVFNQSRQTVVRLIFAAIFLVIIARLFTLQVISGKYQKLAQDNAILRQVIYPNRGIIFDRKGRAILDNTIMYDLMVTPVQLKGIDTLALCQILGIDTTEFRLRVVGAIVKNGRSRPSAFESLLSPEKYARISESLFKFQPAFSLQERPVRTYPYHAAAALLGYVGEVDSTYMHRHAEEGYQPGDYAGRSGLESAYEKQLMGQRGIRILVKDNLNRPQGSYGNGQYDTAAIAGKNLYTSIDVDLQQFGEKLMNNKVGSIVAIDPRTGGILALISSPTFDPNFLTGPDRSSHYAEMQRDPALPMYDRAVLALYPPGSTFKPLDAMVALDQGVISPAFAVHCAGWYYDCGTPRKCAEHWEGHSKDLTTAITWSCNSYFFQVFRMIIDRHLMNWKSYMNSFGLGHKLGVDLPGEKDGYIPDTTHFDKVFGRRHWNSCTLVSLGIGQGETTETPLQIANTMCLIGNKGYYYTPHVVDSISEGDTSLSRYRIRHVPTHIPDDIFQHVIDGMQGVVDVGTGQPAKVPGIAICGKTGTAQNSYKGVVQQDHALFAAFAPKDNPRIAIVVVCENAGWGGNSAAPIAGLMIEKYINDTISDARKPLEEKMEQLNLIPARIYAARDSLAKLRALEISQRKKPDLDEDTSGTGDEPDVQPAPQKTAPAVVPPTPQKSAPPVVHRSSPPQVRDSTGKGRHTTPAGKDTTDKKHDTTHNNKDAGIVNPSQAMWIPDDRKHKPRAIV